MTAPWRSLCATSCPWRRSWCPCGRTRTESPRRWRRRAARASREPREPKPPPPPRPLGDDARNAPNERLQMRSTMVAEHADDVPCPAVVPVRARGAARARRKPPDPRGGLLDARVPPKDSAPRVRARARRFASLVAALRGARVRERSELAELAEESEETTRETRERAFGAKRVVGDDRPSRSPRRARPFGPALEATLTFLGAEGVDGAETTSPRRGSGFRAGRGVQPSAADAPRHPTCRVMAFSRRRARPGGRRGRWSRI